MGPFGTVAHVTKGLVNVVKDVTGNIFNSINGFYNSIK